MNLDDELALDPLELDKAAVVADAATMEGLLRCWARETGAVRPDGDVWTLPLASVLGRVEVPVRHWSRAGWHRFGRPTLVTGATVTALSTPLLAALLAEEASAGRVSSPSAARDLVGRVLASAAQVERHITGRRAQPDDPAGTTPFLVGEQSLLLGHPLHPTPKSREGLSEAEAVIYAPELRGSFALHWFAADRSIVRSDSALLQSAEEIVASFAGAVRAPEGMVLIPVHPWQARDVRNRPVVQRLFERGLLVDLGPGGAPWSATSSVRTVYRSDASVMLKLSLGVRITNSKRENLHKELRRGVEIHRLLENGLAKEMADRHPTFGIVRDPAWLAVVAGEHAGVDGGGETGLEIVIRENPFGVDGNVTCLAGLVAEQPGLGGSHLQRHVRSLADRSGRAVEDIAVEWFARYLRTVAVPLFGLYAEHGIALESHQQNTLVLLDADGWPVGGRYRDNQGFYIKESRVERLERWLASAGRDGDTVVADTIVDERLGYYVGINNLFGLIGAFGSQDLASEDMLFEHLRQALETIASSYEPVPMTVSMLLDHPTLRCKANLLTRIDGLDELEGSLDVQSVYVEIENPLAVRR